ncbi:hypothetical protein T01_11883 [Trichinella spiralis]|uniref:Uncharacterized protein n=1 Tax=Trichinella spiralis TaxID=6334 RepID=A0A0V1APP9_TRISP|nr:hypothetical protein T01_11883 [Trichinella spiralis]
MKRFIAVFRQPVFSPDSLVLIILLEKNSVADSPPFLSCYRIPITGVMAISCYVPDATFFEFCHLSLALLQLVTTDFTSLV